MTEKIALYTADNLDACPWPQTTDGEYAKRFLEPLIQKGVNHFIDNVDTEMGVLIANDLVLPVTINNAQYDNSFVCSPFGHYVGYASILLKDIQNTFVKKSLEFLLKIYGSFIKNGDLNQAIIVNNWLFPISPSPKINYDVMEKATAYLKNRFPHHAILFRSVLQKTAPDIYDALKKNNYHFIVSRCTYLFDGANEANFHTRIFKSDMKFFRGSPLSAIEAEEITESDIPRLQEMYKALYIEKYSTLNPHYNTHFFQHLLKNNLLHIKAAKENDKLVGVVGYFYRDKQMFSPVFGYDLSQEKKGLYRYLSTMLLLEAQKHAALFNKSGGGSFYKKLRRAVGEMEYTAVYTHHLPFYRKIRWRFLKLIMQTFGKKFMEDY